MIRTSGADQLVVCFLGQGDSAYFFSSRRLHTRYIGDWSSDVCSSDLLAHDLVLEEDSLSFDESSLDDESLTVDDGLARSEERRVGKE